MAEMLDEFLAQSGVLGMKWGRRKGSAKTSSKSEDHSISRDLLRSNTKSLTNAELKKVNERLNLEKSYRDLTKNSKPSAKADRIIKDVIKYGKSAQEIYNLYQGPLVQNVLLPKLKGSGVKLP
jgi:hypothetical protein